MTSKYLWGVDLGGTKIEGVVLEANRRSTPLCRIRVETEAQLGYEHVLSQIAMLIDRMIHQTGVHPTSIGFATPGMLDPKSFTLKNSNTTILNGKPLKTDLENALGVSVFLENDANCFALAESLIGAAVKASDISNEHVVFGVILGTGVGGGIVVNQHGVSGCHLIAGEWGHNIIEPNGKPCYCGKKGCVETVISSSALEQFYFENSSQKLTLKEIYQNHCFQPNRYTTATIDRLITFFGKSIAEVINILDPHTIVIGGGVGQIDELYSDRCRKQIEKYLFFDQLNTKIVKPKLGASAGVFGAAFLTL